MLTEPTELEAPRVDGGFLPPFYPPTVRAQHPQRARSFLGVNYAIALGYRNLQMDVHIPLAGAENSPVPLVVWIHGGAWVFGGRDLLPPEWPLGSVAQMLVDAGIAVATIDYRHAREAPFPAQLHDAKAAIRYLRAFAGQLGIDPGRIGVWGESAGGHLAALCALATDPALEGAVGVKGDDSSVSAAVCFYPITDLDQMPLNEGLPEKLREIALRDFGEVPPAPVDVLLEGSVYSNEQGRRSASPITHVSAQAPPFLFIHGEEDLAVPALQSEVLSAALRAEGVSSDIVIVPGAGHVFDNADPLPQLVRAVAFFSEHLL